MKRFGHVGNFVRAAGRDLRTQIACGDGFHAILETHKATYHPTANVIPANDKRGGKAHKREAYQDNPTLADLRLGFTDRGGCRRLAARSQACDFPFEFLGERAIFHHHIGAGFGRNQLSLLELENIAAIVAGLDQLIDEFGRLGILENRSGLAKVPCCRGEPVLDRRQQIGGRQVGRFNKDSQYEVGFGTEFQDCLQRYEFVFSQRSKRLLNVLQVLFVRRGLQADRQGESGVVGHRPQFFGELLMRFPKAGNERFPGGGNGLAVGDRLHQPVEIHQDSIGGFIEPCSVSAASAPMVCVSS